MTTLEISETLFSKSVVLNALRNQQLYADWRLVSLENGKYCVHCETLIEKSEKECIALLQQELADEQIREALEKQFGNVRDLLVSQAFSSIIKR